MGTEKSRALLKRHSDRMSLPLIAAPMFLVSGPDMVQAARREGVIGSFPFPNARTTDVLEDWLRQVCSQGEGNLTAPFAANMVTHSSYDRLGAELDLLAAYKPEIVITALGGPRPVLDTVHSYGGLVFADVNSVAFARKAADAGADGLVLVSSGAGGHTGDMSAFAFVSAVREFFDGVVVLAGGISTGRAVRAAEVLGADLAYMGTSLIAAEESLASSEYKSMVVGSVFEDLVLSNALTGANAYYLRKSLENAGIDPASLKGKSKPDFTNSQRSIKAWRDVWSAGHGVGAVKSVRAMSDIISDVRNGYLAAVREESAFLNNARG